MHQHHHYNRGTITSSSVVIHCLFLAVILTPFTSAGSSDDGKAATLYDFPINDIKGNPVDMNKFKGKALLILNTASQCGHTDSHLKALKRLHEILSYENRFDILAFPCNDFGEQEPWDAQEIEEFVKSHHKCDFPLMEKVKIQGEDAHPLWKYIIQTSSVSPTWNFQKYLFDSSGKFVKSWDANTSIESIFDDIKAVVDKVKVTRKDSDNDDDENSESAEANKVEL